MKRNLFVSLFNNLILVFLFWQYLIVSPILSKGYLETVLLIDAFGVFLFVSKTENIQLLKKQYFRISSLFLIGFLFVHFQIYIDYILGNYIKFPYDYLIDKTIINESAVISSIALYSFFCGYYIRMNSQNNRTKFLTVDRNTKPIDHHSTLSLQILSFVLFGVMIFTANSKYFRGGYGQEDIGVIANYAQQALIFAIISVIILVCRNCIADGKRGISFSRYVLSFNLLFLTMVGVYLFLVLLSGDRGPIFQIGLSLIGGFVFLTKTKLKVSVIVAFILISVVFVSLLGIYRSSEGNNWQQKLESVNRFRENNWRNESFSPNTFELGMVVKSVHAGVSYTKDNSFFYGQFQLYQVVGIIPGLGSVLRSIFGERFLEYGSAEFITRQLHATWGMGTTCVIDIYLDFGIVGILIAFILFGYFLRYLDEVSFLQFSNSLWTYILLFIFLSESVYIGRGTIISLFRQCVIVFFLIKFSFLINKMWLRKI